MTGTIESLNKKKGADNPRPTFGFIRADADDGVAGKSIFFIPTSLEQTTVRWDELETGMRVAFTVIDSPKGLRAIEVRVLPESAPPIAGPASMPLGGERE